MVARVHGGARESPRGRLERSPIGAKRTKAGTVNAAIISYYQSTAFTEGLAESTRTSRRAILERFRNEHGDKRIALLHKSALQAILNKRSAVAAKIGKRPCADFSTTVCRST
jgi:hypothetical protein